MKIAVFGAGYVGLVHSAVHAEVGHDVICVDEDAHKVALLMDGKIPIYEPGLSGIVSATRQSGHLLFSTDHRKAVLHAEIIFIAVGTPEGVHGKADLSQVNSVAQTMSEWLLPGTIVVMKSTVPVGTSDHVRTLIELSLERAGRSVHFDMVSNPEFLKEGAAVQDSKKPDRIILGLNASRAEAKMRALYRAFNRNHDRIIVMDIRSAELTKYAANCMLATKISFMNEMANIAECVGADIENIRRGIGSDPRIGYHYIYAGCGFGGSCFPKDLSALIQTIVQTPLTPHILQAVLRVNEQQKQLLYRKVQSYYKGKLAGKTAALWGLSFKPNTDDMRHAPSCDLMIALWKSDVIVQAYDPQAMPAAEKCYGECEQLKLVHSKEAALDNADFLVICTEWKNFWAPDFQKISQMLKDRVIFDGRNLYDPEVLPAFGITYIGIGRGTYIERS
ncbi:UDP-glucose dehydrogenase family protein [Algicola sagamiensis]|uniref:UDP-glucose dehydrogenase family protein n=1 Tax=Algicola sagamiensis TaxID=163869 RepID=UPI00036117E9|nr:UDP-glucose/GDP-mannose dehydrogenase family protein [Algicola sagamiensis]